MVVSEPMTTTDARFSTSVGQARRAVRKTAVTLVSHDLAEGGVGRRLDRALEEDAGVEDQRVEPAEPLDRAVEGLVGGGAVGEVAADEARARLLRHRLAARIVAAREHDVARRPRAAARRRRGPMPDVPPVR